jgi:U3 small nucleolar RNA-associated protein 19
LVAQISAFKTILSLLRTESLFLTSLHHSKQAQFANTTFAVLVKGLLAPDVEDEGVTAGWINDELREEWRKVFDRYDDLRFYFLKASTLVFLAQWVSFQY